MSQRFTVTAERSGKWWVLESDNGAVSQARSLTQVEGEMREPIAWLAGIPESEVVIDVVVQLPDTYRKLHDQAEEYRRKSAELNRMAAESTREAAKVLVRDMSVREAGRVMGVSHQRVQQLVSH